MSQAETSRLVRPGPYRSAQRVIDDLMNWYALEGKLPSIKTLIHDSRLNRTTVWAARSNWVNQHPRSVDYEKV